MKLTPSMGVSGRGPVVAGFGAGAGVLVSTAVDGPSSTVAGSPPGATTVAESERWTNSGARLPTSSTKPATNATDPVTSRIAGTRRPREATATRVRSRVAARKTGSNYVLRRLHATVPAITAQRPNTSRITPKISIGLLPPVFASTPPNGVALAEGLALGVGFGLGEMLGVGEGLGFGLGEILGVGDGLGLGLGEGLGLGLDEGLGVGDGEPVVHVISEPEESRSANPAAEFPPLMMELLANVPTSPYATIAVLQPLADAVYVNVIDPPDAVPITVVVPRSELLTKTSIEPSGTPALSIVHVAVAPTFNP
jgi:hypothetical protein